ncbi:hypothetical protein GCM10022223_52630 [Kineosporia mesophila]|uniref:Glycosyltransferase 2-like domain-containing protein n=1 Tax=Kineosporia mesophila TaxID=566012 RepID=A0ABP7ABH9_9ACTN|nr:cellulose synthase catalytic subunit [Kineosporia mesophila]MCD5351353.1 cellulose synthase catalytic subunit [Kineosporia mesophila]
MTDTTIRTDTAEAFRWPRPPGDDEKYRYLAAPQHRWLFVAAAMAFGGVAFSFAGLAARNMWTVLFFIPLVLLMLEQIISLPTSTLRRRVTLPDHQFLVETYAPGQYPSVDVFLPTAGEDPAILENTYQHVARLQWQGPLFVHVLDDAARPEVLDLAVRFGFRYVARPGSEFKKAGNLQYAFTRTSSDFILLLDADFVPRPDFLAETIPYFQAESVGIVQTPQYFETPRSMHWLERCAGATQELFFRQIQPSRDSAGAAICVGTSAVYRRSALQQIGGFPLIGHSEDVFTGVLLGRQGFELQYVPVLLSRGRCPDDVRAFLAQQYRWCEGSMSLVADHDFHAEPSMTNRQRLSFWAGFLYYITTAINAVVAPLPLLVMVCFFPGSIVATNMLPLLGVLLLWLVVLPVVSQARWRPDVLRVQTLYGFAHLLCITDMLRGQTAEWVATGADHARATTGTQASRRSVADRVALFMTPWLVLTQLAAFVGLTHGVLSDGFTHYWANLVFALFSAYIFVPVAWEGRKVLRGRPEHRSQAEIVTAPAVVIQLPIPTAHPSAVTPGGTP